MRFYIQAVLVVTLAFLIASGPSWAVNTHGLGSPLRETMAREKDHLRGYVVSGGTHATTSGTLVSPSFATNAYVVSGNELIYVSQAATTVTYNGSSTSCLGIVANRAGTVAGWSRQGASHYVTKTSACSTAPAGGMNLLEITTTTEVTVVADYRITSPERQDHVNVMSPIFGVTADCSTDDTAGLQAALNNAAWRQKNVYAPAGCYNFTKLYFQYDATNNPGWPNPATEWKSGGRLRLYGDLAMGEQNIANLGTEGETFTVFNSTDGTGPAFVMDGAFVGALMNGIHLQDLTVIADNTTQVVQAASLSNSARFDRVTIYQKSSSGNGMLLDNTYHFRCVDCEIIGPGAHTGTGVGLDISRDASTGGRNSFLGGQTKFFGTCAQMSTTDIQSLYTFQNFLFLSCNDGFLFVPSDKTPRGILFLNTHFEDYDDKGIWIQGNAKSISIINSVFIGAESEIADAGDAAIWIGESGAGNPDDLAHSVAIINNYFQTVKSRAIRFDITGTFMDGWLVHGNYFEGDATGNDIAIDINGTTTQNLSLIGNVYKGSIIECNGTACDDIEFEVGEGYVATEAGLRVGDAGTEIDSITQYTLTSQDFPNIPANDCAEFDFTATGAAVSDSVVMGLPPNIFDESPKRVTFVAWVDSADTIRLRGCNVSGTGFNPGAFTYKFTVIKHE